MSKTIKDQVYTSIFEDIIKGKYSSGEILKEKELIERFNVSKSPVREALVQLCSEGVLISRPRFGYEIVRLTRRDIEDILKYRSILEGGALNCSINNITADQIDALSELDRKCCSQEAKDDFWIHWKYNVEFHLMLMSFYNNEFAYNNLKKAMDTLTRAYAQFYWDKWGNISFPKDTKNHADIIKSLRGKDIEKAVYFLREDIGDFGIS